MAKNQAKLLAEMAAFLKKHDQDVPDEFIAEKNYRSDDAVVVFANVPAHFKPGVCKECKKPFATNRKSVGFCSDPCRWEDWKKTTGLPYTAVSTRDVWDGDPPMIIRPEQMEQLRKIAAWFMQNQKLLETRIEQETDEFDGLFDPAALQRDLERPLQVEVFGIELAESVESTERQLSRGLDEFHTSPVPLPAASNHSESQKEDDPFDF